MNKFQAMEVFTRVVETGGITRAADSLRMPKATATTLIQRLEANLGIKLLHRTTRRVSVTPDGAAYYERCQAILADLRETEETLARRHASPRGLVRVDAPPLMARAVIVPALPGFFARYPGIELELGSRARHADLVEQGIDCAVWSGELPELRVVAQPVGQLYVATCAAPAYLTAHGRPSHPDELARHRCISGFAGPDGGGAAWAFARGAERARPKPPAYLALQDENACLAAAEAGLGIVQLPAFVAKEAVERGRLEFVLGDWLPDPLPLNVVYPPRRHLSQRVRVFVDWIATLFAEHDGIQLRSRLHPAQP